MKTFGSLIGPTTLAAMRESDELEDRVSRNMPAGAGARLVHCRLADGRLRLVLDSASWVAKLRFGERRLLAALAADGVRVREISWHVAPLETPKPRESPALERVPDPRTGAMIASVASGVEDPRLRGALERLAAAIAGRRS